MAVGLREMAQQYASLNQLRRKLEKSAEELKAKEMELKDSILLEMMAQGLSSVKIEGIGHLVSVSKSHYEITDIEALARKMYEIMQECDRTGRGFADALLLQKRISREPLEAYVPDDATDAELAALGVKKAEERSLSVRKA